jgi:NADH-quinone oxidoreductase subunit I
MGYFQSLWDGIRTTAQGITLTVGYLKPGHQVYTLQYPDEKLPIDKVRHRGIHEFDVDRCISCELCAKACPVDCIYIESEGKGKGAIMTRYDIDYSKCLFCALCVPPCPTECIQLGERYSLPGHTRDEMVVHFHEGGYPIQARTELAAKMVQEFEAEDLFEKKRREREERGVPTLRPQK